MTATDIILIIGAVGVAVGGFATAVNSIMKTFGEVRVLVGTLDEKVTRVDAKADVIAAVVAKVDGHVNSEKTAGEGRENTLRAENVILREMIADKKAAASLLAQAAAGVSTTAVVHTTNGAQVQPAAVVDTTLAQIEVNTEKTAMNTARTDAAVKKLEESS